ncbi:hypothetical protein [Massilia niabensis]|uniref:LPXTG cell wall anchor domain-containing protein n=1 Tax=Massilia niabensis TaxID=544910 RepID=A0ABW0L5I8_9BURK
MRIKDGIGFLCIAAGIALGVTGVRERNFLWFGGGIGLVSLGIALVRYSRREDSIDAADTLIESIDD